MLDSLATASNGMLLEGCCTQGCCNDEAQMYLLERTFKLETEGL